VIRQDMEEGRQAAVPEATIQDGRTHTSKAIMAGLV